MPLQQTVGLDIAVAVPGQKATPDQAIYTPINYRAGENGVTAGTFCWAAAEPNTAQGAPQGTEAPLGFVERVVSTYIFDVAEGATMTIPEGQGLTIAVKGDYYVTASEAATVGGQVYVDKTNGAILAAAGGNGIAAPGWVFKTSGSAGELVIISNWGTAATVPAGGGSAVDTSNLMMKDFSNATGTLDVAHGGTGASDASGAKANLEIS